LHQSQNHCWIVSGPYKLSEGDKRQFQALLNHAAHGAFRLAKAEAKEGLGMREKQAWEGLGNIPKTEAMRRFVDKSAKIKLEEGLAVNAAKHTG